MEYFELLTTKEGGGPINKLQRIIDNLRRIDDVKDSVPEFFKILYELREEVPEEYKELRDFLHHSFESEEKRALENYFFFVDWNPFLNRYEIKSHEEERVGFVKEELQAIVWGLVGRSLRYLPNGMESFTQLYRDFLEGFGKYTETDTLDVLRESSQKEESELYSDYMSMKKKYKNEIRSLESLSSGLNEILSTVEKEGITHEIRKKTSDWCSNAFFLVKLDPVLWRYISSLESYLIALDTIIQGKSMLIKSGLEKARDFLSRHFVKKILSPLINESEYNEILRNPKRLQIHDRGVGYFIEDHLSNIKAYVEERLKSCPEVGEWYTEKSRIKKTDPPFVIFYHTFFSPINIPSREKEIILEKKIKISLDEMERVIDNFKPDRFKDFRLWVAKDAYQQKLSKLDEQKAKELKKLFYRVVIGEVELEEFYRELTKF